MNAATLSQTARINEDDATATIGRYTWLIGTGTLAMTLIIAVTGPPSDASSAFIMLAAVAIVGLPHGAYDLEVARRLLSRRLGRSWWLIFGTSYLALAIVGLAIWASAPLVGLVALLVGGAAHWGLDDLEIHSRRGIKTAWLAVSRGAIPVAAPMAFHADTTATIFSSLLNAPVNADLVQALGAGWLGISMPGIFASVWRIKRHTVTTSLRIIAEPTVLLLWFAVVPPILAFTIYFCFWHAVRHSLRSAFIAEPSAGLGRTLLAYLRAAILPTTLTWLLVAAAAATLLRSSGFTESIWNIVFVGLFALTVPHIVLEIIEYKESKRDRSFEMHD